MRYLVTLAASILTIHGLVAMDKPPQYTDLISLPDASAQQLPAPLQPQQQQEIFNEPAAQQNQPTPVENYQTFGSLITAPFSASYRTVQYVLGLNDMDWQILHTEANESANVVDKYFDNIKNGIDDSIITSKYNKRNAIATRVAERLTRKLAIFCTNYDNAPKKVAFLTQHNDEWTQITQTDIERAKFLVDQYPKRLLSAEIVSELTKRHQKIQEIIAAIENTDKK